MSATNRHHRMMLAAAGLAMSGALMVACGHAHGERAINGNGNSADSAAVSTTPAESSSATTPSATNPSGMNPSTANPSTTTPSSTTPATTNGTSTARHHRAHRDTSYDQPSASEPSTSAAAGGNASASATTTTPNDRKSAVNGAESTDYGSSAVPDQTASTTTPKARRHRGAAETSNAEISKSDSSNASPNAESASNGLSVSGANAMPAGATCTAGAASGTSYESSYAPTSASQATPANAAVSSDVQSAKDQSKQDTAASHAQQPYDINRPNDAGSLSKTPTNTPDSVGGSLGHRDTTSSAVRRDTSANAYGNWSVTASQPRHDTANASSMTVTANNNPSASVSVGVSPSGQSSSAVSSISSSGTLPPCGWPAGAKGAFLNDAQVADAAIIANSVDSAISAGIAAKTQNAAVREYAQMMIRDHSEANSQMASLVDRTKIAPAENEIADGILRDSTGHTFAAPASTTAMNRVEGQKVTPVTQPQTQPSKTDVPAAAKPAHIDTVQAPAMGGTGSNPAVKNSDTHVNVYDYNSPSSTSAKPDTTKVTAPTTAAPSTSTTPNATTTTASSTTAPQPLTGDDKNYIDFMVQAHQQLLDALDNRLIPFAWNPDLKSALTAMRPVVQRHLDRARELQRGQTTTSQY